MDEVIFDGECHPVPDSKEYGYIAKRVQALGKDYLEAEEAESLYQKYAEYLYANCKEEVIKCIASCLSDEDGFWEEEFSVAYRPPWVVSCIAQYGTLCLKFKRSKKDKLDESIKSCSRCY